MKAIILAGGEGTRLQPLTALRPKPMIPLFDKPLLEHLILLLKQNGFTEICITLRYLSDRIRSRFGNGEELGVWLEYAVETEPRGTAGSVRDCFRFIDGEDFLVISGDAACSFDLRAFYEKHRISGASATILTHPCSEPAEYGLVLTDSDGFVRGFLEKPYRENLVTNQVNTGIYAFSPQILADIPPEGAVDFGSDLFPKLLHSGRRVRVWQPEGYWNDVGTPEAYLQTCRDVLDGVFRLSIPGQIQSHSGAPFWVSPEAEVSSGAKLGAYAVIGAGSRVSEGCTVENSVLDHATLESHAQISGSILCENVRVGAYARVEDGCVLADHVQVGKSSVVKRDVRIWPHKRLGDHEEFRESVSGSESPKPLSFSDDHSIRGSFGETLTPVDLFHMGAARYPGKRIAAASSGGSAAALLRDAFLIGSGSQGRSVYLPDSACPASASFAAYRYGFDLFLFVMQVRSEIRLYFFGRNGLPISRSTERKLEACRHGYASFPPYRECCSPELILGADEGFLAFLSENEIGGKPRSVAVRGSVLLTQCLQAQGVEVVPPAHGIPEFNVSPDGFQLSAIDERGRSWNHTQLLNAYLAIRFSEGQNRMTVPLDAGDCTEQIAAMFGASVTRAGSDFSLTSEQIAELHVFQNGALLCVKLISGLQKSGSAIPLSDLMDTLPDFHQAEAVLDTESENVSVLRMLTETEDAEIRNGICLSGERGSVKLRRAERNRIRVIAESGKAEFASELCEAYVKKLKAFDRRLTGNDSPSESI